MRPFRRDFAVAVAAFVLACIGAFSASDTPDGPRPALAKDKADFAVASKAKGVVVGAAVERRLSTSTRR